MKSFKMLNIEKPPHLQARYTKRLHVLIEWYNYTATFSKHGKKPTKGKTLEEKNHGTLTGNSDDYLLKFFSFLPIFYSVIE